MQDINDGARQLLSESLHIIEKKLDQVVVVGGWGPYLRHTEVHPGTKDVDILFTVNDSVSDIRKIIEKFLQNGFYISAKHDFQLCKAIKMGEHTYIYNVDLLHPTEGIVNKVDFVEIMDLDVTDQGIKVKPIRSINIQYGDVITSEKLFESITFEDKSFNVLDGAGIVISKLNSCHNKKRPRDIFDIYLSLKEENTFEKIEYLRRVSPLLDKNFEKYLKRIDKYWETYKSHLSEFGITDSNAKNILLLEK